MKKVLLVVLLIGSLFAAKADIKESMSRAMVRDGDGFIQMDVLSEQQVSTSAIVFYGRDIGGYSSIIYSGSVPTLSAQAVFSNLVSVPSVDAQTLTAETATTSIYSAYYKFTIPAPSATRNITINFLIKK